MTDPRSRSRRFDNPPCSTAINGTNMRGCQTAGLNDWIFISVLLNFRPPGQRPSAPHRNHSRRSD